MFDLRIGPHINGIPMYFIKILYCLRTKIRYKIHRTSQEQIKPKMLSAITAEAITPDVVRCTADERVS